MRKVIVCLVSALSLAALPAYADRGGHRGYYGGPRHHSHGSVFWPGVAVVGALAGMAIIAERSRPVYVDPYPPAPVYSAPVYAAPVVPARVAPNTWYYCQSSAMYYPYTQGCPEGWQVVPARPY